LGRSEENISTEKSIDQLLGRSEENINTEKSIHQLLGIQKSISTGTERRILLLLRRSEKHKYREEDSPALGNGQ
jgi:hypothetical protein